MSRIATIIFVLICTQFAMVTDINEEDKSKHFQASAGISLASYSGFRAAKFGKVSSSVMSFSLTMLVGHIKETSDRYYDSEDMEADAMGASA
jgi:hypothetical protein